MSCFVQHLRLFALTRLLTLIEPFSVVDKVENDKNMRQHVLLITLLLLNKLNSQSLFATDTKLYCVFYKIDFKTTSIAPLDSKIKAYCVVHH